MKITLKFTVLGPPVGKERPRFNPKTGRAHTPKRTREYERTVRNVAHLHTPRDWPRDRRYKLHVGFTGRCDADNVAKAVADAIQGVCYDNDRQVDSIRSLRFTGKHAKPARTVIIVEAL